MPWDIDVALDGLPRVDRDTLDAYTEPLDVTFADLLGDSNPCFQLSSEMFRLPITPAIPDPTTANSLSGAEHRGTPSAFSMKSGSEAFEWPAARHDLTWGDSDTALQDGNGVWGINVSGAPVAEVYPALEVCSVAEDPLVGVLGTPTPEVHTGSRIPQRPDLGHGLIPDSCPPPSEASQKVPAAPTSKEPDTASNNAPSPGPAAANLKVVQWNPTQVKSPRKRRARGPFTDKKLRQQTGETRRIKACVRCVMQKSRVGDPTLTAGISRCSSANRLQCESDPNAPEGRCVTCRNVSSQKIHTLSCHRYRITECQLYRTGKGPGLEFTSRWPTPRLDNITEWASLERRIIKVMSNVSPSPFELTVGEFVPFPADEAARSWLDGTTKKYKETTPYAIVNMSIAMKNMSRYIQNHMDEMIDYCLRDENDLIKMTYEFARNYVRRAPRCVQRLSPPDERVLLRNYFRLWAAVRRTATLEHIVGCETLDMTPEEDKSFPLHGHVPLPPVLIQQLDMILMAVLEPWRKAVLEDFHKVVVSNKPGNWLTVYLITFMSLHCCAVLTSENHANARKHGLKVCRHSCVLASEPGLANAGGLVAAQICRSQLHPGSPSRSQRIFSLLSLPYSVVQPVCRRLGQGRAYPL